LALELLAHGEVGGPWNWAPHLDVWLIMGGVLALYWAACRYWGPSHVSPGDPPVTRSQVRYFALGVLVFWIGADWPIHEISEDYLFSVHMFQHLLFSLVAPALILMGTPDWMARRLLRPRWIMAIMRRIARPIPALILFNVFLVFTHWPGFVNATVENEALHFGAHTLLVVLSLVMWWPVLSPMPELPRITPPGQMLYLFGQTIVPTVPASFLTFGDFPFYRVYAEAPRLIAGFDAVADQGVAGLVMKVGGGLLLWTIIAILFFKWAAQQESGTPDATKWQDLERELNKVETR
jgi:putative membrane protein